eukprot:12898974-Prorocentrum_lima.AAC.1
MPVGGVPLLHTVYSHQLAIQGPHPCFAAEWISAPWLPTPQQMENASRRCPGHGDVMGQLAVWNGCESTMSADDASVS